MGFCPTVLGGEHFGLQSDGTALPFRIFYLFLKNLLTKLCLLCILYIHSELYGGAK